jgi:hypothetical protein
MKFKVGDKVKFLGTKSAGREWGRVNEMITNNNAHGQVSNIDCVGNYIVHIINYDGDTISSDWSFKEVDLELYQETDVKMEEIKQLSKEAVEEAKKQLHEERHKQEVVEAKSLILRMEELTQRAVELGKEMTLINQKLGINQPKSKKK